METLGPSSGLSPLLRPVVALQGDLAALLREGRLLAGEVLERLDGGTYVIGVAGRRVPAQSPSELEVGSRLELEVVRSEAGPVLRVRPIDPESRREPRQDAPLWKAVRGLVDADPALSRVLEELRDVLGKMLESSTGWRRQAIDTILRALAERTLDPRAIGEGLRGVMQPSALGGRAALLAGLAQMGGDSLGRALGSLAGAIEASSPPAEAQGERLRVALLHALRTLIAEGVQGAQRTNAEWVASFEREWRRALTRAGGASQPGPHSPPSSGRAAGLQLAILRVLFLAQELPGGAELARRTRAQAFEGIDADLEGSLIGALLELPEGGARTAAMRALASLDLEHLLNLARGRAGEALHWSFLLPDGALGRVPVDVFLLSEDARGQAAGAQGDRAWRLTLGIELGALGPLRADLFLRSGRLSMRLLVTRPETAARLVGRLGELREELIEAAEQEPGPSGSATKRAPALSIAVASPEQVSVRRMARETRLLAEHPLMDELA